MTDERLAEIRAMVEHSHSLHHKQIERELLAALDTSRDCQVVAVKALEYIANEAKGVISMARRADDALGKIKTLNKATG